MSPRPHAEPPRPGCATFHAALDAVVDGEAGALSAARVTSHAEGCPRCAARLASARRYRARLRAFGARATAPETLRERVSGLLQAVRGSRTP